MFTDYLPHQNIKEIKTRDNESSLATLLKFYRNIKYLFY